MHSTFRVTTNTLTGQQQQLKATTLIWQQLKNEQQTRQPAERTSDVKQNEQRENEVSAAIYCCYFVYVNDAAALLIACHGKTNTNECKCLSNEWAKTCGKQSKAKYNAAEEWIARDYGKTHVRAGGAGTGGGSAAAGQQQTNKPPTLRRCCYWRALH